MADAKAQTKWWVRQRGADVKVEKASSDSKKVTPAKEKTAEPKTEAPADA